MRGAAKQVRDDVVLDVVHTDDVRACCTPRRPRGRLRAQHGWTLMETMVVTSIVAILSAIAIPQYGAIARQMRTSAAATELLSDLQFARNMSQRTGVPYYINVVTGGTGVNYKVQRALNPPAIVPGSDPTVRTVALGTRMPDVVFSMNGITSDCWGGAVSSATPSGQLVFNTRGLPSGAASYFIASQDGRNAYVVSVTGAGKSRLCRRVGGAWK